MPDTETTRLFDRVRQHAIRQLPPGKLHTTNLHLDEHIYSPRQMIGPELQKIVADRPTILVFADDDPQANFSHACRYLLYDAKTGDFHREVPASLPPFDPAKPSTLKLFHEPVRFMEAKHFAVRPVFRWPFIVPDGERYAVLFSGMSNKRHLNDLEFLFRTLIHTFGFKKDHIFVLSYDGTLNTQDGVQTIWPGDSTPYEIHITGPGTRAALEAVFDELTGKLKSRDELLIHTNNHGGWDGVPGSAYLCTYPSWAGYYNADFAAKLATLPKYRSLIVMMEQCHAGGFNASVLARSTAGATSIASACLESRSSYVTADGNWDPFAKDWIAAQAGHTQFGGALAFNPDADGDHKIQAEEAYAFANLVRDPRDTPNFGETSEAGGDITLGQEYRILWWSPILLEVLKPHFQHLKPQEYTDLVHKMQPELAKLTATLEHASGELRKEAATKLTTLVTSVFGKPAKGVAA